jgi:nucleoside 2-deoxyribosyltransferase
MNRTVTISGSYRKHLDRIIEAKAEFERHGYRVLRPHTAKVVSDADGVVRLEGDPNDKAAIQQAQLDAITRSDLLYVVNPAGYLGPSATLEAGVATGRGVPVFCAERAFEEGVNLIAAGYGSPAEAIAYLEGST